MQPKVILVDDNDQPIGMMEKIEAHQKGLLHRAFSVFIMNDQNQMLLHKRASGKYHSEGLWTNACCSHPMPGESTLEAAVRRLKEEMGFSCELRAIDHIIYQVQFENGLIEHEYDHIFLGYYDGEIHANPEEVSEYTFCSFEEIDNWLEKNEEHFTVWFRIAYPLVKRHLER